MGKGEGGLRYWDGISSRADLRRDWEDVNLGGKVNANSIGASRYSGIACLIWVGTGYGIWMGASGKRIWTGARRISGSGCCTRGPFWRGCLTFLEALPSLSALPLPL